MEQFTIHGLIHTLIAEKDRFKLYELTGKDQIRKGYTIMKTFPNSNSTFYKSAYALDRAKQLLAEASINEVPNIA